MSIKSGKIKISFISCISNKITEVVYISKKLLTKLN